MTRMPPGAGIWAGVVDSAKVTGTYDHRKVTGTTYVEMG